MRKSQEVVQYALTSTPFHPEVDCKHPSALLDVDQLSRQSFKICMPGTHTYQTCITLTSSGDSSSISSISMSHSVLQNSTA